MNTILDYAMPTVLVLLGVALTAVEPSSPLLHALGLLCVAGGGFWLGATVQDGEGE